MTGWYGRDAAGSPHVHSVRNLYYAEADLLRVALFLIGLLASAAQPGYVDSAACAGCHADIARNYARTGMGRSFRTATKENARTATKENAFPEFEGSFFHGASRELFTFVRRDDAPYIRRSTETNVFEERVDYVIGSGEQAISYLHRTRDNKLTEFPVSWYPENGGHWGMSPAYDRPDHPGFSREVNFACMLCHNAYPAAALAGESPGETVFPALLPEGIDCQRCHGPGQKHVAAATGGRPAQEIRASIVNPARLNPERQSEVCLQCHLETTSSRLPASIMRPGRNVFSYRPGEPLADFMLSFDRASGQDDDSFELVSAPYRLAKSACVLKDGKPLACVACHDPHVALSREESVRKTDGVCASCHKNAIDLLVKESGHSAERDCVECHMPRRSTSDVVHATITDHWISKPHGRAPVLAEINARNTVPYAGAVSLYYPKALPGNAENAVALAIAQVQSNPLDALQALDQIRTGDYALRPEMAAEIGRAFLTLGQAQKAVNWYEQAVAKSRGNWIYLSGLGNAQQAAGRPDLAADSFARVTMLAPWETDALFSLGQAYARQGRLRGGDPHSSRCREPQPGKRGSVERSRQRVAASRRSSGCRGCSS